MQVNDTPRLGKGSFKCPHCGAFCQQAWAKAWAREEDTGDEFDPYVNVSTCLVCSAHTVWLRERYSRSPYSDPEGSIIYPTDEGQGPARSADMPAEVASLYDEASTVVGLSPRSASALLRLALEVLLKDLYPDEKNLNSMIGAAVRDGLPEQVQKTMDYMRFNGNQSVHQFHHDDTLETATTLFGLLNFVVERLITQPNQLNALYETLPDGFKEQIGRRDTPAE